MSVYFSKILLTFFVLIYQLGLTKSQNGFELSGEIPKEIFSLATPFVVKFNKAIDCESKYRVYLKFPNIPYNFKYINQNKFSNGINVKCNGKNIELSLTPDIDFKKVTGKTGKLRVCRVQDIEKKELKKCVEKNIKLKKEFVSFIQLSLNFKKNIKNGEVSLISQNIRNLKACKNFQILMGKETNDKKTIDFTIKSSRNSSAWDCLYDINSNIKTIKDQKKNRVKRAIDSQEIIGNDGDNVLVRKKRFIEALKNATSKGISALQKVIPSSLLKQVGISIASTTVKLIDNNISNEQIKKILGMVQDKLAVMKENIDVQEQQAKEKLKEIDDRKSVLNSEISAIEAVSVFSENKNNFFRNELKVASAIDGITINELETEPTFQQNTTNTFSIASVITLSVSSVLLVAAITYKKSKYRRNDVELSKDFYKVIN